MIRNPCSAGFAICLAGAFAWISGLPANPQAGFAAELEKEVPGGYKIGREAYQKLLDWRLFPTRVEMTDWELAEKFDLTRPSMARVKAALDAKDEAALRQALSAYLNSRLPAIAPAGSTANTAEADRWLQDKIEVKGHAHPLGEHLNWYTGVWLTDSEPVSTMGLWVHPLGDAYEKTGDVRYAQRIITFIRSLYHDARPPAQRPVGWQYLGPWQALCASGRIFPNYLPYAYQVLRNSPVLTDADRVMFLKMFSEHADHCYLLLDKPHPHNFAIHVLTGLTHACRMFPEFKDRPAWLERIGVRYVDNMSGAVLDDGGVWERSAYHWAYLTPSHKDYQQLKELGAPLPKEFTRTLNRMYDWGLWMLSPGLEWPLYAHGDWQEYHGQMGKALELFPERADIRYAVTNGKEGAPPSNVARVLHHSGFATMRSDWSRDALYLAFKWNNFLAGQGGKHDIMSFGLWANGHPWMTNPGSTAQYDQLEYDDWCMETRSHNTIEINWRRHDIADNTGRLESWTSLPDSGRGFTYLAAVSNAYASQRAQHRRAVLFVRGNPGYWLMYDRVAFDDPPNTLVWYPFDITWNGHFQPTELSVDAATKTISTAPKDGKRLHVIPADPDECQLQQDRGPICAREKSGAQLPLSSCRAIGPWIKLRQKSADYGRASAFAVLLCPTKDNAGAPSLRTLPVTEGDQPVNKTVAFGCRVVHPNGDDDLIAVSPTSARRVCGNGNDRIETDAETAYVRRQGGKIVEAGIHRGSFLKCAGAEVLRVKPGVTGAYQRFDGGAPNLIARGGAAGAIQLSPPTFSTTPADICRASGVVHGYGAKDPDKPETGYLGAPRSLVVTWTTPMPADATLEYRLAGGKTWLRSINPELTTEHRILLSQIKPGASYELRLTGMDADGRSGVMETRCPASVTSKVRQ